MLSNKNELMEHLEDLQKKTSCYLHWMAKLQA